MRVIFWVAVGLGKVDVTNTLPDQEPITAMARITHTAVMIVVWLGGRLPLCGIFAGSQPVVQESRRDIAWDGSIGVIHTATQATVRAIVAPRPGKCLAVALRKRRRNWHRRWCLDWRWREKEYSLVMLPETCSCHRSTPPLLADIRLDDQSGGGRRTVLFDRETFWQCAS